MKTQYTLERHDRYYPSWLEQIHSPPPRLYAYGALDALEHDRYITIVGSRNPSAQGLVDTRYWAKQSSQQGIVVVSGLAIGIDGAAHQGALEGPTPTIAVIGGGLDKLYPRAHHLLADSIAKQGVILSEYPDGTPAQKYGFVQRNRILAGLSQATLVMEAAIGSGSLGTAHFAMEEGREVFAVPGSIHNPTAQGCHALIQEGAHIADSFDYVLQTMGWQFNALLHAPPLCTNTLSLFEDEALSFSLELDKESLETQGLNAAHIEKVWQALKGHSANIDLLIMRTGLSAPEVMTALTWLMLDKKVLAQTGGQYGQHFLY